MTNPTSADQTQTYFPSSMTPTPTSPRRNFTRTPTRRTLRNEATYAEKVLWRSLRNAALDGRKFTRQKGILGYIVDFYCGEERLAIELDGSIHDLPQVREYDLIRERELLATGIAILRFSNNDVVERLEKVLSTIRETWKGRARNALPARKSARSRATRATKRSAPAHSTPAHSTPQPPPLSEEGEHIHPL